MPKVRRRPRFRGLQVGPWRVGWISDAQKKRKAAALHSAAKRLRASTFGARFNRRRGPLGAKFINAPVASFNPVATVTSPTVLFQGGSVCDVPAAAGDSDGRVGNEVKWKSYSYKGIIDYGTTPSRRVRVVALRHRAGTTPWSAMNIDDISMYGRQSADIYHVYFDKTFTFNGTDQYRKINFRINWKGAKVHYSDSSSTSQDRDTLSVIWVSDSAGNNTTLAGRVRTRYWE